MLWPCQLCLTIKFRPLRKKDVGFVFIMNAIYSSIPVVNQDFA